MVSSSSFLLLSCFHEYFSGQVPILCVSRVAGNLCLNLTLSIQYSRIISVLKHIKKGGIDILQYEKFSYTYILDKAFQFS